MTDTTTGAPELLPCPFCGGDAEYYFAMGDHSDTHEISCRREKCATRKRGASKIDACTAWNTRQPPQDATIPPEPEWQPISTAPRDRTIIDLYARKPTGRGTFSYRRFTDCFWGADQWLSPLSTGYKATHWMHRPAPPKPE